MVISGDSATGAAAAGPIDQAASATISDSQGLAAARALDMAGAAGIGRPIVRDRLRSPIAARAKKKANRSSPLLAGRCDAAAFDRQLLRRRRAMNPTAPRPAMNSA